MVYTQIQKSGKVRFFEKYRDPLTGNQKTVSVVMDKDTTRTRKQAAAILQDKIRQRVENSHDDDTTFQELTERFLKAKSTEVKHSTARAWGSRINGLLRVLGPSVKTNNLTAKYIYTCFDRADYSVKNKNIYLSYLKTMLRWAYRYDIIQDISFIEKLQPYKEVQKVKPIKYLEADELQIVIDNIKKQKWKDLAMFLALTGMRIGEALALTIDDIEDRNIHITKTKDIVSGRISDTPKTKESYRDIYIQDQLLPLIRKLRHDALAMSMVTHERLLFQDKKGGLCYGTFVKIFKAASQSVEKDLSPHSLRHTHTSLLAEQGVPLEVISRRLGHAGSDITKQVYLHVTSKQKEKDAAILKSITI